MKNIISTALFILLFLVVLSAFGRNYIVSKQSYDAPIYIDRFEEWRNLSEVNQQLIKYDNKRMILEWNIYNIDTAKNCIFIKNKIKINSINCFQYWEKTKSMIDNWEIQLNDKIRIEITISKDKGITISGIKKI